MEGCLAVTADDVDRIDDLCELLDIFENLDISAEGLGDFDEFKERLQLHLSVIQEGNYKRRIARAMKESGKEDDDKRKLLKQMFVDLLSVIEREGKVGSMKERFKFVTRSLETEGTTHDIIGDCRKMIEDLKQRDNVLLIAGESSAGKSSVLNLLIGEDILPVHTKSCTAVITIIKYGQTKHARIIYKNGEVLEIPRLNREGIKKFKQIAFPEDQSLRMGHEIKEINLFMPLPFLQTGLVLADTPGIGENEFLEEYLVDYINDNQILGFMYIIMSDAAGGVQEDRLLNLLKIIIKQQKRDLRFDPKAALFVCNRFDMIPEEDRPRVKIHIEQKLASCWPEFKVTQAVPFSTFIARRDVEAHPDYINKEYKQLLDGLNNLYIVAMDRRIRSSYKWIEKILKRVIHYLKGKIIRLDLSEKELHEKTDKSKHRLLMLTDKSGEFLREMRGDLDAGVQHICTEARTFINSTSTKMRLAYIWSEEELPSPESIGDNVLSARWVKQCLDDICHDRLCELLEEWDKEELRIDGHEEKMTRLIRERLNLLEEDITDIEAEIQGETNKRQNTSLTNVNRGFRFSVSIPEESVELSHLQIKFNKKAVVRMKNPISKVFEPGKAKKFLKKYNTDPKSQAIKRAKKFYTSLVSDNASSDELLPFVKQLMQRPYEYLKILERKIPALIDANQTSLAEAEETTAFDRHHQQVYVEMMTAIEELRRSLMDYGEGYVFVNDFKSNEIKLEQESLGGESIARTFRVSDMVIPGSSNSREETEMSNPHGLWSVVYVGRLCPSNNSVDCEKPIAIRMYNPSSGVDHTFQEVAKLRCLVHNGSFLAEFLGIHHTDSPTPAFIYNGQLKSAYRYRRSCSNPMEQVPRILRETVSGLQYLHKKGLVHMELSQNTLTVDETGSVRMTGVCLPREARLPVDQSNATADFIYLAPEVLKGDLYLATADIYCIGLLWFEFTARCKDHFKRQRKTSFFEFSQKLEPFAMLQLDEQGDRVSEAAKALIQRCMSIDPSERPRTDVVKDEMQNLETDKIELSSSSMKSPAEIFKLSTGTSR